MTTKEFEVRIRQLYAEIREKETEISKIKKRVCQ